MKLPRITPISTGALKISIGPILSNPVFVMMKLWSTRMVPVRCQTVCSLILKHSSAIANVLKDLASIWRLLNVTLVVQLGPIGIQPLVNSALELMAMIIA